MTLEYCSDVTPAEWITHSGGSWQQLALYGPSGFEKYARLRFNSDPDFDDQRISDSHRSHSDTDEAVVARLCDLLARETTTPDDCYFAMWDGSGNEFNRQHGHGRMAIPNRSYHLFCGPLSQIGEWTSPRVPGINDPAAFIWPADHAWCIASDTDPHWAGIGASSHIVETLLVQHDLDVVASDRSDTGDQFFYTA
jgi:hypothetical protein